MSRIAFVLIGFITFALSGCGLVLDPLVDRDPSSVALIQVSPEVRVFDPQDIRVTASQLQERMEAMGTIGRATTRGAGCIVITAYGEGTASETFVNNLISMGLLEFVDVSIAGQDQVREQIGLPILTRVGRRRGVTVPDDAFSIGGRPFPTIITGDDVVSAQAQRDLQTLSWKVAVQFTPRAARILGNFTEGRLGRPMGIVLDGILLSAPIVQARIEDEAVITGNYTATEAYVLAAQLNSGPLRLPLEIVQLAETEAALDDRICFGTG